MEASSTQLDTKEEFVESTYTHSYFGPIPHVTGEFWTVRQRQMHSLHYVISYRASYKPELPHYFIQRFSEPGQTVLDPFGGRGTTALESVLLGRRAISVDVNPLSERIVRPKLQPVSVEAVADRIAEIDFEVDGGEKLEFGMFFHEKTERQLRALRRHLRRSNDPADRFIELVALSRLHGHSPGFFSVYSFPQISVTPAAQERINKDRKQQPEFRNVPALILRKAKRALRDGGSTEICTYGSQSLTLTADSRRIVALPDGSADLIITSPPFLNKADYVQDNWLEFWFCGIDSKPLRKRIFVTPKLSEWRDFMKDAMREMHRLLRQGCRAAIEVGEVRDGDEVIHLDEVLVDIAADLAREGVALIPERMFVHQQEFTKLANCFRVDNNQKGTNTNRIVIFRAE